MKERANQTECDHAEIAYSKTEMQKEQILGRLKEEGCRITKQRQILLDIILGEECSCCKEIYYKASLRDSGIGMATVYRMVNMLEKIGAISRKNMYRVASEELTGKHQTCMVELSDHTVCSLTSSMWINVIKAGLKEYGFIRDQEIENIMMQTCI